MKTNVKELIKEIESYTGKEFDPKNKRHIMYLESKIERFYSETVRKLTLIERVLKSEDKENDIYSNISHYTQKRYKDN